MGKDKRQNLRDVREDRKHLSSSRSGGKGKRGNGIIMKLKNIEDKVKLEEDEVDLKKLRKKVENLDEFLGQLLLTESRSLLSEEFGAAYPPHRAGHGG